MNDDDRFWGERTSDHIIAAICGIIVVLLIMLLTMEYVLSGLEITDSQFVEELQKLR